MIEAKRELPIGRKTYQPLHPSVRPLLDPEYVAFHDKYVQFVEPDHNRPWDGSVRSRVNWPYAGSPIVSVGRVQDVALKNCRARIFVPHGQQPRAGWPVLLWFHGGGWAVGDIQGDNDFCSQACRDARCVVITLDYRLAPEHPWPAPVDDAVDAVRWITDEKQAAQMGWDRSRLALGGASAGANVAAAASLKVSQILPHVSLRFQLLVVPVTDNTATLHGSWRSRPHAPWLTPARMMWYRNMYLPNDRHADHWLASPLLAPIDLLAKTPPTWIAVADQDMLAAEGRAFAERLRRAGVDTAIKSYPGMPHHMMALSGVLTKGRQLMLDAIKALSRAFDSAPHL